MPKQPKLLPPRNPSGQFSKKASTSKQQLSPPPELDPSIREREPSPSSSTLPDTTESTSSNPTSTPRIPLIFPKPVRHSVPGSYSPLADSPSDAFVPVSAVIEFQNKFFPSSANPNPIPGSFSPHADTSSEAYIPLSALLDIQKKFTSPSTNPDTRSRTPSPLALPESVVPRTHSAPPSLPSDPDSDSSSSSPSSSRTVSRVPPVSSKVFPVNFRASQFLSSCPDPPSTSQVASSSSLPPTLFPLRTPSHSHVVQHSAHTPSTFLTVPPPSTSASASSQTLPTAASLTTTASVPPPTHPQLPPIPPARMAAAPGTGPAAMPAARSHHAPYFSGRVGDPLDDFLWE
jgi:hypothetical protein